MPLGSPPNIPTPATSLRERINALPEGEKLPIIEVRVGSDSDLPKIRKILDGLNRENIPVLVRIASAHRTPEAMSELARAFPNVLVYCEGENDILEGALGIKYLSSKLQVVTCIAAAGGSAHIAGMTASETEIPILAFPVPSSTNGQYESDASMRDMPPGIPNGTSAYEEVLVDQARQIYRRTNQSSETIYLSPDLEITHEVHALINKIGLNVVRTLEDGVEIGIYDYIVDDTHLTHENNDRDHIGGDVLRHTNELGTSIAIINPLYARPIDTNVRNLEQAQRIGILLLNRLTTPGLSMGTSIEENTKLTNSILFAAKIIARYNEKVRDALAQYRQDLTHAPGAVRSKDVELVTIQLQ